MRRSLRLLASTVLVTVACSASREAYARTISADPIAWSFIYPVGNAQIPPTWDPRNGNGYFITQGFNDSCDPSLGQGYYAYGLYYCGHTGVDLASQGADSTVHAAAAGVVTEAQEDGGYGVTVRIRHTLASGRVVYSQYEHMQYGSLQVYAGEDVRQGQPLGLVGATGFANGAHLHFEMKTIDEGGPGYTFGNDALIAPFFDPLAFVAAHSLSPSVLITPTGRAVPEWPAEADTVLRQFLAQYAHFVVVDIQDGLYVRAGAGTRYRALGIALRGAKLGYIRARGDWLYVSLPQRVRGWVNKHWVKGYRGWGVPWPPHAPVAVVSTLALNIHSYPGERHVIVGVCFAGDVIAIGSQTANWTHIRTREGTRGWVVTRYLLGAGLPRAIGGGQTIQAAAAVLNVRSGPGLEFPILGKVFKGTAMKLMRLSPHWAAVVLPGSTTGWVAREYTSLGAPRGGAAGARALKRAAQPARETLARVVVGRSPIRRAPGDLHPIVARIQRGTTVQVVSSTAHWLRVALPATAIQGWILRRDVRVVNLQVTKRPHPHNTYRAH